MFVTSARDAALSARACPAAMVSTVLFVGIGLLLLDFDHRPTAPVVVVVAAAAAAATAADEEEDDEESEDSGRRSLRSASRSSPPNNSFRDDDVERCLQ